ncbi:MAG: ATP-binding protein [Methanosarcinales archaeon]|jgi:hypothetical protein|nr:ATP-binding protein [Methanosarcinales archaeon]
MAVLFIKEFDILLRKYEDYFKKIGFKIYYLIPLVHKNNYNDQLDNYNFEAYIPTLLPLLTGDNIYPTKLVFSRELIQNSVDAIAVRENKSNEIFSKKIIIELGIDESKRRYFKIIDSGSGMDRYSIERYFTSIGRSFYSDDDYEDLGIYYKPISQFGIGFLSSFMVCKEIDVETKYYTADKESLKLHIPNYDGCFFIETCRSELDVGTSIKLYLDCDLEFEEIIEYISKIILDLRYDLQVINFDKNIFDIPAHNIRSKSNELQFFVPFAEDGTLINLPYIGIASAIENSKYGLLIQKHNPKIQGSNLILNAGILVENASLNSIFCKNEDLNYKHSNFKGLNEENGAYTDIILNFPSNWIQIDVSRENITEFSNFITQSEKNSTDIGYSIAEVLSSQISEFLEHSKTNEITSPVIYIEEIIRYAISFCGSTNPCYTKLLNLTYIVNIVFTSNGILFEIVHASVHPDLKKDTIGVSCENDIAFSERIIRRESMLKLCVNSLLPVEGVSSFILNKFGNYFTKKMISNPGIYDLIKSIILSKSGSGFNSRKLLEIAAPIDGVEENWNEIDGMLEGSIALESLAFSLLMLPNEITSRDPEDVSFVQLIEKTLMKRLSISDVECGNNIILIKYDDLETYVKSLFVST